MARNDINPFNIKKGNNAINEDSNRLIAELNKIRDARLGNTTKIDRLNEVNRRITELKQNQKNNTVVNLKPSMYGEPIDLGSPNGEFIPGGVVRLNEVGSKRYPVPGGAKSIDAVRENIGIKGGVDANLPGVPMSDGDKLKVAIAAVNRPRVVEAPTRVAVDPRAADIEPRRAATVDPLNLFGNKNGYNPFSGKERRAAGAGPLSVVDFFKGNL